MCTLFWSVKKTFVPSQRHLRELSRFVDISQLSRKFRGTLRLALSFDYGLKIGGAEAV
jgi:hypothetical protein